MKGKGGIKQTANRQSSDLSPLTSNERSRQSGTLFVCGTPIGNLRDITLRALDIFKEVDLIAAEDTRASGMLMAKYEIKKPMASYHRFNEAQRTPHLIKEIKSGKSVALISTAGMPGISDPGERLIKAAIENNVPMEVIPGPSAVISALVISGLPTESFLYTGFLPKKEGEKKRKLLELKNQPHTLIFYESPRRIKALLELLLELWGDRQCALVREITKRFEEARRGTLSDVIGTLDSEVKGEIVLLVHGATGKAALSEEDLEARLRELTAWGVPQRAATKIASKEFDLPQKEIYSKLLSLKNTN